MTYLISPSATKADCLVAGLLIGASLMVLGIVVIWCVRGEVFDRRALRKQKRIFREHVHPAATSPLAQEAWEQHVAVALAKAEEAVYESLAVVADVVPIVPGQRSGGES